MLGHYNSKQRARLAAVLIVALATTGCSMPGASLSKIPFISGNDDPNKETWSEGRARKKEERALTKARKNEERAVQQAEARAAKRGDQQVAATETYFEGRGSQTQRDEGYRSSPSGISPYAEGSDSGEPQLRGGQSTMERRTQDPMTAEQIGQMASISTNVRRATKSLRDLQPMLRGHDRIYTPRGIAPFPTVLFFHGCSGPTRSHETDWATFYTGMGYAMIAVDSLAGRDIEWEDVCNLQNLNPAERAGDVFATIEYARKLPFVDPDAIIMTGFSHGAATVWATLLLASGDMAPIGIRDLPRNGLKGVQAAYMFYGPCLAPWTVDVPAVAFLGENDRYIDPRDCARSARKANVSGVDFDYEIYPGATHTFDHRKPNQANQEAGSVFDRKATEMAQARIKEHLTRHASN